MATPGTRAGQFRELPAVYGTMDAESTDADQAASRRSVPERDAAPSASATSAAAVPPPVTDAEPPLAVEMELGPSSSASSTASSPVGPPAMVTEVSSSPPVAWMYGRQYGPMPRSGFNVAAGLAAASTPSPTPSPTSASAPPPRPISWGGFTAAAVAAARRLGSLGASGSLEPSAEHEARARFALAARDHVCLTYRSGLAPIGHSNLTTDAGWGCMLRSGQMLVCEALLRHSLGLDGLEAARAARIHRPSPPSPISPASSSPASASTAADHPSDSAATSPERRRSHPAVTEATAPSPAALAAFAKCQRVLAWFHDTPGPQAPYSIHALAVRGANMGVPVGQWHGPQTTAQVFASLLQQHRPDGLTAVVAVDGTVYCDDVAHACTAANNGSCDARAEWARRERPGRQGRHSHARARAPVSVGVCVRGIGGSVAAAEWRSVLVLVPVRLGLELNTVYLPALSAFFSFPQSVGIAGGRQVPQIVSRLGSALRMHAMRWLCAPGGGGAGTAEPLLTKSKRDFCVCFSYPFSGQALDLHGSLARTNRYTLWRRIRPGVSTCWTRIGRNQWSRSTTLWTLPRCERLTLRDGSAARAVRDQDGLLIGRGNVRARVCT